MRANETILLATVVLCAYWVCSLMMRFFKRSKSRGFPEALVLILAIQRSGSTWLYDTFRCHPWIAPKKRAIVFDRLGLKARRYPRDLVVAGDQGQLIETKSGLWEFIPQFQQLEMIGEPEQPSTAAIEKFHAHDFHFDVIRLCKRLDMIEKLGTRLLMVYQLRQPLAAANSFLNYQHRRNDWYPHMKEDKLAQFLCNSLRAIEEVAARRPGIVVDYGQLHFGMHQVVEGAYNKLWPTYELANQNIALRAELLTKREKRDVQAKDFLGKFAGPVEGFDIKNRSFFERNARQLEIAQDSYLNLIGTSN